jgi:hypothetical protein
MRQPSWMCVLGLGRSACTKSGNWYPSLRSAQMHSALALSSSCHKHRRSNVHLFTVLSMTSLSGKSACYFVRQHAHDEQLAAVNHAQPTG